MLIRELDRAMVVESLNENNYHFLSSTTQPLCQERLMRRNLFFIGISLMSLLFVLPAGAAAAEQTVNLYSARK
ncbi:MAG: hypothetical protein PVI52_03065, partial [Chromatiales bacterium]